MLDWFLTQTSAQVIFLTRHPGSQALSVLRQGWGFGVEAYFHKLNSVHSVFTDKQVNKGLDILNRGDQWDIAILDWVVSTHFGRNCNSDKLIKLAYEEVMVDRLSFLEKVMVGTLNCTDMEVVKKSLAAPSGSSSMSTNNTVELIKGGDKATLLSKWRSRVSQEQLKSASATLDIFEVDTYSMYEDMPLVRFLS